VKIYIPRKATKVLHLLSSDPETVRLSELREKAIWDEVSRLKGAKAEGIQQGIQQGMQQGMLQGKMDVARRMLVKGVSIEDIADITGLSVEEVCKLQN
jgi:predicted transposase/invertase (TIGR01784 family)